ncbi:MAG: hypothetical protein K2X26_00600 [Chitinophagaceae bacterium]|nr:hypothetical protein [Chitinophagaceae bacterium]
MRILIWIVLFYVSILFNSCNNSNYQNVGSVDSTNISDSGSKRIKNDYSFTGDDSDLLNIVKDYKATYTKSYDIDTSFESEKHLYRVNFSHKCLFDSSLIIPEKFVSVYGLKEFVTHNFQSSFKLYKDSTVIVDMHITKSLFSSLIDESLREYGNLLYPRVKIINQPFAVEISYSLSIPLTDIGKLVKLSFDNSGRQKTKDD